MDNQQFHPHWTGETSCVIGPDLEGVFSIPARALNITWGNDPRYWEWIKLNQTDVKVTGFEEAAMLRQVNWLEITRKVELPTPMSLARSYKVYYMLKFNEDAFGWSHAAINFSVKLRDDEQGIHEENAEACEIKIYLQTYREKPGVWHQVPGGEFTARRGGAMNVEVGMSEVETQWWKGSMILGGIKIMPNH